MRARIHRDRKTIRPVFGLRMQQLAAAAAAIFFPAACIPYFTSEAEPDVTASPRAEVTARPEPDMTRTFEPGEKTLKMCCVEKACATVDDSTLTCNLDETAKTCDENGEYCTNHGGPEF